MLVPVPSSSKRCDVACRCSQIWTTQRDRRADAAHRALDGPGVSTADSVDKEFVAALESAVGLHRVGTHRRRHGIRSCACALNHSISRRRRAADAG